MNMMICILYIWINRYIYSLNEKKPVYENIVTSISRFSYRSLFKSYQYLIPYLIAYECRGINFILLFLKWVCLFWDHWIIIVLYFFVSFFKLRRFFFFPCARYTLVKFWSVWFGSLLLKCYVSRLGIRYFKGRGEKMVAMLKARQVNEWLFS